MRWIATIIMKMILQKAKNDQFDTKHTIVKQAYEKMIKNYENTIMFLKADRK
jgi:hypothetical protein